MHVAYFALNVWLKELVRVMAVRDPATIDVSELL